MKIETDYSGQPFVIVGWKVDAPAETVTVGWTRSPLDIDAMRQLRSAGGYQSVQYRDVKNRRTGDA